MAASDDDSVDDDADGNDDDGQPGFDLAGDIGKMSEAERRKWDKSLTKWRVFVDFLVRHIAVVTFKFNCFEHEDLTAFMLAVERAESLRMMTKLKKGDTAKITSIIKMKESIELLLKNNYLSEANRIRQYIDLVGRMRGLSTIAGGLFKALKKGKVKGLDRIKHSLDFWKGFCVRSFDFSELNIENADTMSTSEVERQYMAWPAALRTSLFLSQRFLRGVCDSTGLELINTTDSATMLRHMQTAEYVLATKMEQMLFERVLQESAAYHILTGHSQPGVIDASKSWTMPSLVDIDPVLLKPIEDSSLLLSLPPDPPKEKKRKKGRKGKGKKSAGKSPARHKSGKKKKK